MPIEISDHRGDHRLETITRRRARYGAAALVEQCQQIVGAGRSTSGTGKSIVGASFTNGAALLAWRHLVHRERRCQFERRCLTPDYYLLLTPSCRRPATAANIVSSSVASRSAQLPRSMTARPTEAGRATNPDRVGQYTTDGIYAEEAGNGIEEATASNSWRTAAASCLWRHHAHGCGRAPSTARHRPLYGQDLIMTTAVALTSANFQLTGVISKTRRGEACRFRNGRRHIAGTGIPAAAARCSITMSRPPPQTGADRSRPRSDQRCDRHRSATATLCSIPFARQFRRGARRQTLMAGATGVEEMANAIAVTGFVLKVGQAITSSASRPACRHHPARSLAW